MRSPAPSSRTTAMRSRRRTTSLRYAAGNFYVNDKPTGAVVGTAAVRRRSGLRHERQGRLDVEPDPVGQPSHDQGDARTADRLPLPVPAAGRMTRAAPGLALAGIGVALSLGAHHALPDLPPLVLCVALGIALANLAHVPFGCRTRPEGRGRPRPQARRGAPRARPRLSGHPRARLPGPPRRRRCGRDHLLRDAVGRSAAGCVGQSLVARRDGVLDLRRLGDRGDKRRHRRRRGRGRVLRRARDPLWNARDRDAAAAARRPRARRRAVRCLGRSERP